MLARPVPSGAQMQRWQLPGWDRARPGGRDPGASWLEARTLQERGGSLVLLRSQPPVAKMLALIGADQVITIRGISLLTP